MCAYILDDLQIEREEEILSADHLNCIWPCARHLMCGISHNHAGRCSFQIRSFAEPIRVSSRTQHCNHWCKRESVLTLRPTVPSGSISKGAQLLEAFPRPGPRTIPTIRSHFDLNLLPTNWQLGRNLLNSSF